MTDASVGGLVKQWREMAKMAFAAGAIEGDDGHAARWHAVEMCADELDAALPDLLYAAGEHASIKALLSDAQIEGLTVYQQVETLLAARTAEKGIVMLDVDAIARRLKETESGFQYRRHVKGEASARTAKQEMWALIEEIQRLREAARTAGGWQPIASCPKDGTWFLAWDADGGFYTFRDGPGLMSHCEDPSPTHWMPIPAPPKESL